MTDTVTARAPVRPRPLSRDHLKFVRPRRPREPGTWRFDHWAVKSTGNYGVDCQIGRMMAHELVDFIHETHDFLVLPHIVLDLLEAGPDLEGNGIVVGFFSEIAMDLLKAPLREGWL